MESINCQENNDTEAQKSRAFLREKFLKFLANIACGEESEIKMYEKTFVTAKLRAFDSQFENIAVENLQTPYKPVDKAILRTNDIISINLNVHSKKLLL